MSDEICREVVRTSATNSRINYQLIVSYDFGGEDIADNLRVMSFCTLIKDR